MSEAPRRSLRMRNSNLPLVPPVDKEGTVAGSIRTKRKSNAENEVASTKKKSGEDAEVSEEQEARSSQVTRRRSSRLSTVDTKKDEVTVVEKKKRRVSGVEHDVQGTSKRPPRSRNSRITVSTDKETKKKQKGAAENDTQKKRGKKDASPEKTEEEPKESTVDMGEDVRKEEEQNEENEEMKDDLKREESNEEEKEETSQDSSDEEDTVVYSRRPRRSCVATVKRVTVDDESHSSSSSDYEDSSMSSIEDLDVEREEKRAKRMREKGKGVKRAEKREEEDEGDSDDEPLIKKKKKDTIRLPRKTKANKHRSEGTVGRRKSTVEKKDTVARKKRDNVVSGPPTGHYDVDEEEMAAWEAKAVVMRRKMKLLERDTANKGEIMDRVNAFVAKQLVGRKTEMGESESVRAVRLLEKEFDEARRDEKMTVAQRLKKSLEKKREEEDEQSEEEDEWEEMQTVDDATDKGMQVYAEHPVSKDEVDWKSKWLRAEVNRTMRQRQEMCHKVHLLSFIAHLVHLHHMATSPDSLVAHTLLSLSGEKKGRELIEWFDGMCRRGKGGKERSDEEKRLLWALRSGEVHTERDEAILLFSFLCASGATARIVVRCEVMSKTVPKAITGKKKTEDKRKSIKKEERNAEEIYWVEVWNEENKTWEATLGETESRIEDVKGREGPVPYYLAIDKDRGISDVSARFVAPSDYISREYRNRRVSVEWWEDVLANESWNTDETRLRLEKKEWETMLKRQPMPTIVAQFKDHPLYVLEKDVLKLQIIFPYDTEPLGEVRGHKIFARSCVHPINTENWYLKMGRQIKMSIVPCREKWDTNPFTKEKYPVYLYGYWQTEEYDAGVVEKGRIPRNDFDNIYLYQPSMCPKGGIHLTSPGLMRVAEELGMDYVPAVIGWHFKGGNTIPIMNGAVYVKKDLPMLVKEWIKCEKRWRKEEKEKRTETALANWKKLVKGAIRLELMRKRFAPVEGMKDRETEEAVRNEQQQAWPARQFGGDMFEE